MIIELFSNYFATDYNPDYVLSGSYNYCLVGLSVFIAAFTSIMSLHLVGISINNKSQLYRQMAIFTSGLAMGCGIWAMHFIGMLAFHISAIIYYDPIITVISLLPGVIASIVALYLTTRKTISTYTLIAGGIIVGSGIGLMHYIGMHAMQMGPLLHYDPFWFAISIVVAVVLAITALLIQFKLRNYFKKNSIRVVASGCIMGAAISGMHYMGMNSAVFIIDGDTHLGHNEPSAINFIGIATAIVTTAVMMFVAAANWLIRYRQLLSEIRESESRLRSILKTAVDGIITVNDQGIIQGYNRAAEKIFGWSAHEAIGNSIKMLMPESYRSQSDDYLKNYQNLFKAGNLDSGRELMAQQKAEPCYLLG